MAQLVANPFTRTEIDPDPGAYGRPAPAVDGALARMTRLSAALLRAPTARAYLLRRGSIELQSTFPALPDAGVDDPPCRSLAVEVIRSGHSLIHSVAANEVALRSNRGLFLQGSSSLGVPIPGPGGAVVGALCITDLAGREWTVADTENLADFAAIAVDEPREGAGAIWPPAPSQGAGRATGVAVPTQRHESRGVDEGGSASALETGGGGMDAALVEVMRQRIVGALHLGALHAGDRLPSIRQTARAFSVTPYTVLQTYAELEVEGLVERRERSGVFVADFEVATATDLPETGEWLTDVLTQACQHQVKIPHLPDLIRRWTSAVRVRCACVESCLDSRVALSLELSQQFGIEARAVPLQGAAMELGDADLVITTAFHAVEVGGLIAGLGKPLLIATVSPLVLSAALNHLRERDLTVICVDRTYGERLRSLHGGAYRDRVRVVTVDDASAVGALDRSEPVLLTPAARQRLQQPDFRLIAPLYPSYSLEFARKVAEALVRINLHGARA